MAAGNSSRWKRIVSFALVLSMVSLTGCGEEEADPSVMEETRAEVSAAVWDTAALARNNFVLYQVNCGWDGAEEGEAGLCQSLMDQPYGLDPVTGNNWGYTERDYLLADSDGRGAGLTGAKWTIDPEKDVEAPEIAYRFQLPEGRYSVTVGFFNPPGVRQVDVQCEGEMLCQDLKLLRYKLEEAKGTVLCQDGELNLRIYNDAGKNFMDYPMVSYIRIQADPEYTTELLSAVIAACAPEDGAEDYTKTSWQTYADARETAEQLLQETNSSQTSLKAGGEALQKAYQDLIRKYRYTRFAPGQSWRDTENELIQAHGGQVQQLEIRDEATGEMKTKWVWVGEDKSAGYRGGIRAYSSEDLYNWQFEGVIMRNVETRQSLDEDPYFRQLYADYSPEELDNVFQCLDAQRAVIERPKLLYNEKTGQYVLWFHADGPTETSDSNYAAACAGLAVSDSPFGPYRFVDRYRLNTCPADQEDMHPQSKGMARDMNLFKDTDGTAYIIYSSEENLTLYISKLNDSYTYLSADPGSAVYGVDYIRLFPGAQREAPALFLRDGKYYLLTSGCTGWAPNQARYYTADSVLGEWTNMGDPCVGDDTHTTFQSQSTCVFQDPESGTWIYMGDRWNADNLTDSRYVWLPIDFDGDGNMTFSFVSQWELGQ